MLEVKIPGYFQPEIKYTLTVLLKDFLGLKVKIQDLETQDSIEIFTENGNCLELQNFFFSSLKNQKTYLDKRHIPEKTFDIEVLGHSIRSFSDVSETLISESRISLGVDVIGPTFFMLSRWEEVVHNVRDKHDRFPGKDSLAQREGFHLRPIVNEYLELLWDCLSRLGIEQKRLERHYEPVLTCDVDFIQKYYKPINFVRAIGGDLIIRKNPLLWFRTTTDFIKSRMDNSTDPFYMFDYMMTWAEKLNTRFHFYFMPLRLDEFDARYNMADAEVIIKEIQDRGHVVGIHPGYNTYKDQQRFITEVDRLKEYSPNLSYGRQHYLRVDIPKTLRFWNETGLSYDSTLGYENDIGFRCGVCYDFPVFDVENRTVLKLRELPLHFMEVAYIEKYGNNRNTLSKEVSEVVNRVKSYNGKLVLLWHNNNLKRSSIRRAIDLFEELLTLVKKNEI